MIDCMRLAVKTKENRFLERYDVEKMEGYDKKP
jgi:hypothetical protein